DLLAVPLGHDGDRVVAGLADGLRGVERALALIPLIVDFDRCRTGRIRLLALDLGLVADIRDRRPLGVARGDGQLELLAHREPAAVEGQPDLVVALVLLVREPEGHLPPELAMGEPALFRPADPDPGIA